MDGGTPRKVSTAQKPQIKPRDPAQRSLGAASHGGAFRDPRSRLAKAMAQGQGDSLVRGQSRAVAIILRGRRVTDSRGHTLVLRPIAWICALTQCMRFTKPVLLRSFLTRNT
jgi:hypothetical protein